MYDKKLSVELEIAQYALDVLAARPADQRQPHERIIRDYLGKLEVQIPAKVEACHE